MEKNYEKQYNKITKFDQDIMSNLFFQLGTEHNRVYQFEKFKNDFKKNIYNSQKKLNVNYSYDNKSIYRNKILNDASYIFTESNKQRDENDNKLNLRYYLNPSPSQDLFPTQISQPQKLKKNVLKTKRKNENINNKKKMMMNMNIYMKIMIKNIIDQNLIIIKLYIYKVEIIKHIYINH